MNKCLANNCTHSAKFVDRYDVVEGKVIRKDNHKWHFCTTCDKVVHKDYISYHEMKCKSFHEMQKNCIEKDHYGLGFHSEGVACNM